jgi:glucose-1-phosphate thymidylyltransferase
MGGLTAHTQKVLLEVAGKTLLEHKFDILPDSFDEIVLVIGYLGAQVQERFGNSYHGKRITYVTQEDPTGGTADALWKTKTLLKKKFLVMYGDDIYAAADIQRCLAHDWSVLVYESDIPSSGAKVVAGADGRVLEIVESGPYGNRGAVNAGMYALDTRIFRYPLVPKERGSGEYGLPQTLLGVSDVPLYAVKTGFWIQITEPEDLKKAEVLLAKMDAGRSI